MGDGDALVDHRLLSLGFLNTFCPLICPLRRIDGLHSHSGADARQVSASRITSPAVRLGR